MASHERKCFIIMPFSATSSYHTDDYWTNHYENFLKPFIEIKLPGFNVCRSEPSHGSILDKIIVDIIRSKVVIADITDYNPNVIWELGIRHSFNYGTILIAEKGTKLRSDFKDMGVLFYDFSQHPYNTKMNNFFNSFEKALNECTEDKKKYDSPVLHASPRGTFYEIINRYETIRKLDSLLLECDFNLNIENIILNQCIQNQKIRKENPSEKFSMTHISPRWSSLEYLSITQYLEQPNLFYKKVENYLNLIIADYSQFTRGWVSIGLSSEETLIKNIPNTVKTIEEFKKIIEDIKSQLEGQL
jgi:hypothetical protein